MLKERELSDEREHAKEEAREAWKKLAKMEAPLIFRRFWTSSKPLRQ